MSPGRASYRDRIYDQYVRVGITPDLGLDVIQDRGPRFRKIIREHFPSERNVEILELGCGAGPFMYFAQQAGYRVRGVDASREQVAAARRLGIPGVEEGDLLQTLRSLPDESQDVVICFDVIEHFRKEELLEFSDEIWRVLRKGGKWIIHVPNGESPFFGKVFYGDFTHEQAFTRFSIKQLVLSSGYHQVVCFEDAPIPHGLKSCLRWAMWKVIRGVLRVWLTVETGTGGSDSIFSQNFVAVAEK